MTALGTYRHSLTNHLTSKRYPVHLVIVKENFTPILGLKASLAMNFITINEGNFDRVNLISVSDYQEVFSGGLRVIAGENKLRVDPTIKPVIMPDRRGLYQSAQD